MQAGWGSVSKSLHLVVFHNHLLKKRFLGKISKFSHAETLNNSFVSRRVQVLGGPERGQKSVTALLGLRFRSGDLSNDGRFLGPKMSTEK